MTDQEFQKFLVEHLVKLSEGQEKTRQHVARIEFKHGEKLSGLFAGYGSIKNTLADHTNRLQPHRE